MARVSDGVLENGYWSPNNLDGTQMGLTLDRYAQLMGFGLNGFNGVNKPSELETLKCAGIWGQNSRDRLAIAIVKAEIRREQELGYFVGHKATTDDFVVCRNPISLRWKHLISVGTPTLADISSGVSTNLGGETAPNDPVTITVASTIAADEIGVYYPGEEVPITPSSVSTTGALVTIKIPRGRLVKPSLMDDRDDHLSYYKNVNFLATVDIKRLYYDPSDAALYTWRRLCTVEDCTLKTQSACTRVASPRGYRLSSLYAEPATYTESTETWSTDSWDYCPPPDGMQVDYLSGKEDMRTLDITMHLAHTLLPYAPCDCEVVNLVWEEDRTPGGAWTAYGNKTGAINAWMADSRNKVAPGGTFPRMR